MPIFRIPPLFYHEKHTENGAFASWMTPNKGRGRCKKTSDTLFQQPGKVTFITEIPIIRRFFQRTASPDRRFRSI